MIDDLPAHVITAPDGSEHHIVIADTTRVVPSDEAAATQVRHATEVQQEHATIAYALQMVEDAKARLISAQSTLDSAQVMASAGALRRAQELKDTWPLPAGYTIKRRE